MMGDGLCFLHQIGRHILSNHKYELEIEKFSHERVNFNLQQCKVQAFDRRFYHLYFLKQIFAFA